MKDFLKTRRFKVLLVVFFLLLGSAVAAVEATGISNVSNQVVTTIVAPIKSVSSSIASSVTGFFERFTKASAYYDENQELKEEIQKLKEENVELKKYKTEYEAVAEIAGMREVDMSLEYLPAMVIGRDPLDQTGSFTIGKGSVDGVELGDPVITSDGLIGRVDQVTTWESHVSTIYNPRLQVGVYCVESLDRGTTTGDMKLSANGQVLMTGIDVETPMKAGDTIVTYGSEYYPRDLQVGKVIEVKRDEGGLTNTAVFQAAVDISKVREVIVITNFEGQASQEIMRSNIEVPKSTVSEPLVSSEEISSETSSTVPINGAENNPVVSEETATPPEIPSNTVESENNVLTGPPR